MKGSSMKKYVIMAIVLAVMVWLGGCCSPEMTRLARESAINVNALNDKCQAGDDVACKEGLSLAAESLDLLADAMEGE
jgi:hypothetical protein